MKNLRQIFSLMLLMCLCSVTALAQDIQVKGVVTDKTYGDPVIGATVSVVGTKSGTVTDFNGEFELTVAKNSQLQISFVGLKTVTLPAQAQMEIVLEDDATLMEELVVTGYMTEKKTDLTGSVAVVKMKDVADIPTGNVMQALSGRVAGMNITTDGTPGGGNTNALVRGTTSINGTAPLYVIDGVPTRDNVGSIVASGDVESIQVLKDASSAAIYGAQAANGVIIITTKRAKKGETKIDFSASLTAQTFSTGVKLLNTQQWGDCYWQAYSNANNGNTPQSALFGGGATAVPQEYYMGGNRKMRVADTNWAKEIYSTALLQTYNLTLSRGGENGSTSLSLNYMDHDGICRKTDYKSFNTRLTTDYKLFNNIVRVGENIAVTRWTQHFNPGGIEEAIFKLQPMVPTYGEDGGYGGGYVDVLNDTPNPLRLTDNQGNNKHERWRVFGNAYLELEPIKNLVLRSNFGLNYYHENNKEFVPRWDEGGRSDSNNFLSVSNARDLGWIWTNQAQYSFNIDKHGVVALLGMEAKRDKHDDFWGNGRGLHYENESYQELGTVTSDKNLGGGGTKYSMVSYFGKVNYNYDDRYLFSATVRRDASSRFGSKKNAGIFPSFSAGWRISEEKFMENTKTWLSDLKLRAAWGINGSDLIDNAATYNIYTNSLQNGGYNFAGDNTTLVAGTIRTHSGNPYLKWEQTTQTNVGFDAAFLNNRLLFGFDYFYKNTTDMLYQPAYAAVLGQGGYSYQNLAAMTNKGAEFSITWRDHINDFNYEVSFNGSVYKNKITKLPEDCYYTWGCGNGDDITNVGYALGSWLGYKTDGVFHTQQEVDEYLAKYDVQHGKPGVGRLKYVDTDGDGKINAHDRVVMGSDQPKFIGGLNLSASWKGFDMSLFFNGMIRDAWNNSKFYTDLWEYWLGNHSTRLLNAYNAWEQYKVTGYYDCKTPALTTSSANNENESSDFYIEDGSFIKLKTLTLGYTLPKAVQDKLRMRNLRVYFQAQNLFTLTKYKGADPEGLGYAYPIPRTFTLGINIGF